MAGDKDIVRTGGTDGSIYGSPVRMFNAVMRTFGLNFETCIPAIVEEYNRNSHMVLARPLVNMVSASGEQLKRDIIEVPARRIQHGGFLIDIPILKGDTGWIIASDRDSENALLSNCYDTDENGTSNKGPQRPNTKNIHKYRFGFFIPDRWGYISLDRIDPSDDASLIDGKDHTGNAVIRSMNGKTRISISKDGDVDITLNEGGGKSSLTLNADLTVRGNISASGNLSSGGHGSFAGYITTNDSISASGEIFADGKIGSNEEIYVNVDSDNSVKLSNHKHTFSHVHSTPLGNTGDANPQDTGTPIEESIEENDITATVILNVTGSIQGSPVNLFNVIYDRLQSGNATPETTSKAVGTTSFTIGPVKIRQKTSNSYTNSPYLRIGFAEKTSNYQFKASRGALTASASYGTATVTAASGPNTVTERKYIMFDFSQYLNNTQNENRNVTITANYVTGSIVNTAQIETVQYMINGHAMTGTVNLS